MATDARTVPPLERISTGIPELDEMLAGGLLPHRPYLVVGPPGAGKTTLSLQFLIEGIRRGEEVLFVTLEEPPNEVRQNHQAMGPEFEQIYVFDAVPDVMRYERTPFKDIASVREAVRFGQVPLTIRQTPEFESVEVTMTSLQPTLRQEVRRRHYKRMVIDSLTALQFFCMPGIDLTQGAQTFLRFLSDLGLTTLLTLEVPASDEQSEEHLLARGELRLFRWEAEGKTQNAIGVEKFRGSAHDIHLHPYRMSPHGLDINLSVTISSGGIAAPAQADTQEVLGVPPEEVAYEIRRSVLNLDQDIRDLVEVRVDVTPMHEGVRFVLTALADHRFEDALIRLRETRALADRLIDEYQVSEAAEKASQPAAVPSRVAPVRSPVAVTMPSSQPAVTPAMPPLVESLPPPPLPEPIPSPALLGSTAPALPLQSRTPAAVLETPTERPAPMPPSVVPIPPPPPAPPPVNQTGPTAVPPVTPLTLPPPPPETPQAPRIANVVGPRVPEPPRPPLPPIEGPPAPTLVHRFFRRAPKPTAPVAHATVRVARPPIDMMPAPPPQTPSPTPPLAPAQVRREESLPAAATPPTVKLQPAEPVPPLRPPPEISASFPKPPVEVAGERGTSLSPAVPGAAPVGTPAPPPAPEPPRMPAVETGPGLTTGVSGTSLTPSPPVPPGVTAGPAGMRTRDTTTPAPPHLAIPKTRRTPAAGSPRSRRTRVAEPAAAPSSPISAIATPPPESSAPGGARIAPPKRQTRRRRKAPPVTSADLGPMPTNSSATAVPASPAGRSSEPAAKHPPDPPAES
ncbi:MAG: hypothetical protein L3K14_09710 [Thermoplasmata archaeon]|nr:hypothetical protein [Thermoplasmata archaeon]